MSTRPATPESTIVSVLPLALNAEGGAPEWIELIPAGFDVRGRDGREWINPDPHAVVAASAPETHPIPLDWEHATEHRAPQGLAAPAAAWIEQLEVRDGGSIWGRVTWTAEGGQQVAAKAYRFVSPVFAFDKITRVIRRLVSVGLTNTPNLLLTALNREGLSDEQPNREPPEKTLSIATVLAGALGLSASATDDQIVAAVNESLALNRANADKSGKDKPVDLSSYAPRADLDAAVNRANAAETRLAERDKADREAAIEAALAAAQDAGKVIPASAETYRAMCREEGGLERFQALVPTLPVIAGAAESRAANKVETKEGSGSQLTDEERAVCRALGQDEATFKSSRKEG